MATKAIKKEDQFLWEGTNRNGLRVRGEARAQNMSLVKADLRRQGINPLKVKKITSLRRGRRRITPKDIAVFSRQLATMISAGVPLVQSFESIGRGHENPRMQDMLLTIKGDIEGGSSLVEALEKHPVQFDELFCNLVRAGEHAGILEGLLHKIATYKEKTEALKGKIKKALWYPAAVIIVAFVITAILLVFVIPVFQDLFKSSGADLPALTLAVINLSAAFREWWWLIIGVIIGTIGGLIYAKKRSRKFAHLLDRMALKIPVIGQILNKAAIARYARTLATMFAAGVPLVEAMQSVAGAAGNIVYSNAILRMRDEVATGQQLNQAMRNAELFPNMVVQMAAIGEEAGSLDAMLSKVADFYEEEVDNLVDSLASLLEPFIMVILGVLIGGLVIAMYLPIFKIGSAI
jgi:type IV pilus assembly protein PilC